jgi:hypothetical protein
MSYQNYQQHHQQAAIPQAQGHYWNGSAWVPQTAAGMSSAGAAVPAAHHSNFHSEFASPPSSSAAATVRTNIHTPQQFNKSPVELYTEYYHGWKTCRDEYQRLDAQSSISSNPDRKQRLEWARWYADESSRAAHYYYEQMPKYNQNYNIIPPPPFDLPPAPPSLASSSSSHQAAPAPAVAAPYSRPTATARTPAPVVTTNNTVDDHTPGSLTSYVQRSLQQCRTDQEKAQVQSQVEQVIARAIQQGKLHTRNWALEPLIVIPRASTAPTPSVVSYSSAARNTTSSNSGGGGYYGPASATATATAAGPTHSSYSSSYSSTSYYSAQRNQHQQPPSSSSAPSSFNYYSSQANHNNPNEDFMAFHQPSKNHKNSSNKKLKRTHPNSYYGADDDDDDGLDRSSLALKKRQARFSGPGGLADSTKQVNTADYGKYMGLGTIGNTSSSKPLTEEDYERMTVKGTCTILEKEYLRLTAPPKAELVRPQAILSQHLEQLKQDYYGSNGGGSGITGGDPKRGKRKRDYLWFCSQLKAVRQDLTIQRIQNAFAIHVYETHARIALQEGDLNEFNQCQTQLKELYSNVPVVEVVVEQSNKTRPRHHKHQEEFLAYRLLYHVFLTTNDTYQGGTAEITKLLGLMVKGGEEEDRTEDEDSSSVSALEHALQVRQAVALSDYLNFFRLHESAPNLGKCLTEQMVPTIRFRAFKRITKAYRPSVEVEVAARSLGFDTIEKGRAWIESSGGNLSKDGTMYSTKDSDGTIHEPEGDQKNSLI